MIGVFCGSVGHRYVEGRIIALGLILRRVKASIRALVLSLPTLTTPSVFHVRTGGTLRHTTGILLCSGRCRRAHPWGEEPRDHRWWRRVHGQCCGGSEGSQTKEGWERRRKIVTNGLAFFFGGELVGWFVAGEISVAETNKML